MNHSLTNKIFRSSTFLFRTRWTLESFDFLHVSRCCTSHHLCRYALHYQVWFFNVDHIKWPEMQKVFPSQVDISKQIFLHFVHEFSYCILGLWQVGINIQLIFSLLPLANIQNQRVLVRLNTILTVAIALTCMLNVLASTLIFAESKESFYQPQPANPIDDE